MLTLVLWEGVRSLRHLMCVICIICSSPLTWTNDFLSCILWLLGTQLARKGFVRWQLLTTAVLWYVIFLLVVYSAIRLPFHSIPRFILIWLSSMNLCVHLWQGPTSTYIRQSASLGIIGFKMDYLAMTFWIKQKTCCRLENKIRLINDIFSNITIAQNISRKFRKCHLVMSSTKCFRTNKNAPDVL